MSEKMINYSKIIRLTLCISFGFLLIGCNLFDKNESTEPKIKTVKDYSSELTTSWYVHYTKMIARTDGYRPPVSARSLAHIGLATYEAAAPGMKEHQSIASSFSTLKMPTTDPNLEYHWGVSTNAAFVFAMRLFVQNMDGIDFKRTDSVGKIYFTKYAAECDTAVFNRSKKFGESVALAVYTYSIEDGQVNAFRNNKPTDYTPPIGLGLWERTPPDYFLALTPRWGKVRTFVIKETDKELKPHILFSIEPNSEFYKQAKEVYDAVKNTTTESKWIGEFWSDDFNSYTVDAAGRWFGIANNYMAQQKTDLETALYVNAKLGMGLHDAAVACWNSKYSFNLQRPVTYINKYIDKNWKPILRDPTKPEGQRIGVTPQHPSYPSGHSVFGAVAAAVFINQFGDKINFTDRTHEGETYFDGRPRTFTSFTQMADENAYSRIPLGVHYRMDCVEGLRMGYVVGARINAVNFKKRAL
jgi:hypothetical protein